MQGSGGRGQARFAVQVCLVGSRDEFVTSGSDDGRIFIWSRHTGRLVNILTSDDQNVTALAAHPSMPFLASAGSEPTIKLWSPQVQVTTCVMMPQCTLVPSCVYVCGVLWLSLAVLHS